MSEKRKKIEEDKLEMHDAINTGKSNEIMHVLIENIFYLSEQVSELQQRTNDIEISLKDFDAHSKR